MNVKMFSVRDIAVQALVAAVYTAVSLAFLPLTYMAIQFRFAEMLMVLPFVNKKFTVGVTLGCLLTNLFSPIGILDVIFGTLATLIACIIVSHLKSKDFISVIAALVNAPIIGLLLYFVYAEPLWLSMGTVFIGELVVVQLGVLLVVAIEKNTYLQKIFKA